MKLILFNREYNNLIPIQMVGMATKSHSNSQWRKRILRHTDTDNVEGSDRENADTSNKLMGLDR